MNDRGGSVSINNTILSVLEDTIVQAENAEAHSLWRLTAG
jgi:hypothetical protein